MTYDMKRNVAQSVVTLVKGLLISAVLLGFSMASSVQARGLPDFTKIVDENSPAVVNISTSQKVPKRGSKNPHGKAPEGMPEDLLKRFFDDKDGDKGEENNAPEDLDEKSLGSGFIVSSDGYVLTNHHVIKGADEIVVRLSDRRELVAKLVGTDNRSDVAVLKIEADNLPVAKIGRSRELQVGEWVLAIGSPFDFDHTVTAGIVSAVGRNLPSENYVPFIQTDVAINPGNSGGPLFNLQGEVVGINAQIYSRTGGYMGLSFAIPIDLAMNVVEQLKSRGHVTRGWLGVLVQDVTRDLAESFGLKKPGGAAAARVMPNSPAQRAGFEVGDVIVEFDGKEVTKSSSLPPLVGVTPIGKEVEVKVIRQGKPKTLKVSIGELPAEEEPKVSAAPAAPEGDVEQRLGVAVVDLSQRQRAELDNGGKGGVMVQRIKEGPAQKAGVRSGDILLNLNGVTLENVAQFKRLVAELPVGKSIPLLVQRRDDPIWMALKIPPDTKK
jgi:serine protease Do